MRRSLLDILRAPQSGERLTLHAFKKEACSANQEENVIEGILVASKSQEAYPIVNGVPVMLRSSFTQEFLHKHAKDISGSETLSKLNLPTQDSSRWSFSREWDIHFNYNLRKTWGWTVEDRANQFCLETARDREGLRGKIVLDAGCGNGQLSEELSYTGATVVALDYSTSVFHAERKRKSVNVHFVRGDLQAPPFGIDIFDIVYSSGVLHHTPDTYKTFSAVAQLVRPDGCFYIWLYRRPEKFLGRYFILPAIDLLRLGGSRVPPIPQAWIVKAYALGEMTLHRILAKSQDLSWKERVVIAYDSLTPLWRHYHNPWEVCGWFFLNGYSAAIMTHWDNPYGFGMVATKKPQPSTPGLNYESVVLNLDETERQVQYGQ